MGTVAPVLHRGDKPTEKRPDGKRARFRQSPELVPDLFRGLSLANIDSLMSPEGEFARQWRWQEIGASIVAVTLIATR